MADKNKARILILGTGGAVNSGLPHNSVLLNNDFLVDCPHDIIPSLRKNKINSSQVSTVFISHFHADHYFGLPFFILDRWITTKQGKDAGRLQLVGPAGIREKVSLLTELAWGKEHPCYGWFMDNTDFQAAAESIKYTYRDFSLCFFPMEHMGETWGFTLVNAGGESLFSYMTDTKWCQAVQKQLKLKPRAVLIDVNGGFSGIHMSYDEVIEKCLPITGKVTKYYGSHLESWFDSAEKMITIIKPGMVINI